jgi:hypothetical protein
MVWQLFKQLSKTAFLGEETRAVELNAQLSENSF